MNCGNNTKEVKSAESDILTRQDMMKLFTSIDRTLIREAQRNEKTPSNLSELDQVVTELLRADIPDVDINAIASGNKVIILPGEVTREVSIKTSKVLENTARAVKNISVLPQRATVEIVLKYLKGPLAKTFIYSFIPSNSDLLVKNPDVRRKRAGQIDVINAMSAKISFPVEYLKKHIRNAIVEHYRTNPEQILHDIANGKDTELESLNGLGEFDWGNALNNLTNIVDNVSSTIQQFKPAKSDYQTPVQNTPQSPQQQAPSQPQIVVMPPTQNYTNDPAYTPTDNTVLYIGLAVGGLALVGGGVALALR